MTRKRCPVLAILTSLALADGNPIPSLHRRRDLADLRRMPRLVAAGEGHPLIEVQHAEDRMGPRVHDLAQSQAVAGEDRLPERLARGLQSCPSRVGVEPALRLYRLGRRDAVAAIDEPGQIQGGEGPPSSPFPRRARAPALQPDGP